MRCVCYSLMQLPERGWKMFADVLVCRQQGRFAMRCLGNDDAVKRVACPIERECGTDDRGKRQFAGFQPDVAVQAVEYVVGGAIDTGDFMQVSQLKLDHRGDEQLSRRSHGAHSLWRQARRTILIEPH